MANTWSPDRRSGITIHIPAALVPLLAFVGIGIIVGVVSLEGQSRTLRQDLARLTASAAAQVDREQELAATIARQHAQLRTAEGELEMIRFQIEAVEMQLDGVDYLSRQLRTDLGLPPSAATWSDDRAGGTGQGGSYVPASPDRERLGLVQQRLAAGLAELYDLQQFAQSRAAAQADVPAPAADRAVAPVLSEPANWPARGDVTSPYGWRVFRARPNFHPGIDVSLPYGTPVMATGDGVVVGSGWQPGYGWSVLVQHATGYNTLYAHLSELSAKLGDRVAPGQLLGLSGSSGNSTGPHLHYEIWRDGQPLDPRPYMDGSGPR